MTKFPLIQSPNMYHGRHRAGNLSVVTRARLLVVHDWEADLPTSALDIAHMFAQPARKASAHGIFDRNSIIQSVSINDTAWHAPNANADGIGGEFAGFAKDTKAEWIAEDAVLDNGAQFFAECVVFGHQHGIPFQLRRLSLREIANQNGPAGFCGHIDVTNAFHNPGGHTDPGNQFPWSVFLGKVNHYVGVYKATPNWQTRLV